MKMEEGRKDLPTYLHNLNVRKGGRKTKGKGAKEETRALVCVCSQQRGHKRK